MTTRNRKEAGNYPIQPLALQLDGAEHPAEESGEEHERHEVAGSRDKASLDRIEVSPRAIAHLASRSAQASYGVVGLASRHARPGWADILHREEEHKGVEVKFSGERVVIDLYVVIEYGTRISEVARNIMSNTKFAVESALGVPVVQVNVNVQGVRVSA